MSSEKFTFCVLFFLQINKSICFGYSAGEVDKLISNLLFLKQVNEFLYPLWPVSHRENSGLFAVNAV
ncbi:hypothetical protein D9603_01570 [Pseudoalteromonas sp. PS5]|nr:hypothetical protein D9603_01570 [Pseudoalteromonas sp. PS5]